MKLYRITWICNHCNNYHNHGPVDKTVMLICFRDLVKEQAKSIKIDTCDYLTELSCKWIDNCEPEVQQQVLLAKTLGVDYAGEEFDNRKKWWNK